MTYAIPLFDLNFDSAELRAARRVLQSRWLTMGPETEAFEAEFAAFIGRRHAIAVSSCTAALHLAYEAVGARGGEVICPSLTFVATAAAAIQAGADPVLADIESLEHPTLSPEDAARRVGGRTRALCLMHYGGMACDAEAFQALARQRKLALVEDCAHSPGATLHGGALGTFGDVACFSFFSNKNLATGEGGMICCDDDELARRMRLLRSHGMTSLTLDRHKGHAFSYDVLQAGFNYRLDELRAAIGREQLKKLRAANACRSRAAEAYRQALESVPGLILPLFGARNETNCHIFPVALPQGADRRAVMESMMAAGIQTSVHYPPIHRFRFWRERQAAGVEPLPATEAFAERELTLPMHPLLTESDIQRVAEALGKALKGTETGPARRHRPR